MPERAGYRGYVGSRSYRGRSAPQRVQNLVVRDYCARRGLRYLLSSVEYAFEGSYVVLEDVLREIDGLDGVVLYSVLMLPHVPSRRRDVMARILAAGASLHGACEDIAVRDEGDARWLEDMLLVDAVTGDDNWSERCQRLIS